jgi:disulfide oxidoreductase YuzD
MNPKHHLNWLGESKPTNYPAAQSYLALLYPVNQVTKLVARLQQAPLSEFKAKDVFRASQLSLLGVSNRHVKRNEKKIRHGEALSPILLVRDPKNGKVVIADGYHRMCAIYHYNEDAVIHCKIV